MGLAARLDEYPWRVLVVVVVFGVLVWAGAAVLIDAFQRRNGPDLGDRLRPFAGIEVADEARRWLDRQG